MKSPARSWVINTSVRRMIDLIPRSLFLSILKVHLQWSLLMNTLLRRFVMKYEYSSWTLDVSDCWIKQLPVWKKKSLHIMVIIASYIKGAYGQHILRPIHWNIAIWFNVRKEKKRKGEVVGRRKKKYTHRLMSLGCSRKYKAISVAQTDISNAFI